MNLLFVTRKIDEGDPRVGFVHSWIWAFAAHVTHLILVSWQTSNPRHLPPNCSLLSLESDTQGKIRAVLKLWSEGAMLIRDCDGIFIHMMPVYVLMCAPFAKRYKKPMYLWYTHKQVDRTLALAVKMVNGVVTASQDSFRLRTAKNLIITGHGVDTDFFTPSPHLRTPLQGELRVLSLGRISPSKRYEQLIEAVAILKEETFPRVSLAIVGAPALARDHAYIEALRQKVRRMHLERAVSFEGPSMHSGTRTWYQWADIVVNLSQTGSIDKAVLEAMACGALVVTSNEAFAPLLAPPLDLLFCRDPEPHTLAAHITRAAALAASEQISIKKKSRAIVVQHHNVRTLAAKIISLYTPS